MERHTGNLVLDALPDDARGELLARARREPIVEGTTFLEPDQLIERVFFPLEGTLSLVTPVDERHEVECATVGREGAVGVLTALGIPTLGQFLLGQVPGDVLSVDADDFGRAYRGGGRVAEVVHGYIGYFVAEAAITVGCNAVHHVAERLARWLLMTHDRVHVDRFDLKQSLLAVMLGVHRPAVSVAAGALQHAGFISYRRGVITVEDREGLESAACACYERTRSAYSRLVPLG
ncbi:MAG TPA: Crp/Fnr family transcriptional regulator [Actinomycetota bacterium]